MTNCATPAPRARVAGRLAPIAPLALSLCALAGAPASAQEFRTITGEFNNPVHSEWGAAGTMLVRCPAGAFYGGVDQTWEMGGENRVSARMVSNLVFAQPELVFDDRALTDMVWQWGQFLDHDLDLTPGGGSEAANIPVPAGDRCTPAASATALRVTPLRAGGPRPDESRSDMALGYAIVCIQQEGGRLAGPAGRTLIIAF